MYLCVCAGGLSEMHCMANEAWQRVGFCTEPPLWEPRLGPSPGLGCAARGCAEQRAQTGGTGGLCPLTTSVRASRYLWGAFPIALRTGTCPRTGGSVQIPAFIDHETEQMHSGRNLCKYIFFVFPFSLCILGGT